MLSIGEFATLTHLSVRTLRRYHDGGLLEPARVDPATGYRSYSPDQIPTAQVIHQLRTLDVPLEEVRAILGTPDPAAREDLVAGHLRRLTEQLDRTRAAVASLHRLLRPEPGGVELRAVPATRVAGIEAELDADAVPAWFAGAVAELRAAVPEPAGPLGGGYDDALFGGGRGRAVLHLPADDVRPVGRVRTVELPAVELAVRTHVGDHATVDVTYGELGRWVAEHALAVAGPVRETYLVGPQDSADPAHWRTEVGWPVFRLS